MPKNVKNLLILGGLFILIIFIYGKNIFKSPSSSPSESMEKFTPSPGETFESSPESVFSETSEEVKKTKRVPLYWGRDPFIPEETPQTILTNIPRRNTLFLSGIAYKDGDYLAVIDGKIVRKGDIIEDREIVNIEKDRVMLKKKDKFEVLKLREE